MTKWLLNNLGLKIVALILAVGSWFYIAWGLGLERKYVNQTFEAVPVKVLQTARLSLEQEPSRVRVTPDAVTVVVRGPQFQMQKLTRERISIYIDISSLKITPGSYNLPVAIDVPQGIEVVSPYPLPRCEVTFISER